MLNDLLNTVITWVQQLDPVVLVLIAGLAILLETSVLIGLLVPGDSVLLAASAGVTGWGTWAALVAAAIIGALLGETIGYWIGHWLGEPLKRSRLGKKLGAENWQKAEEFLDSRGGIAVFISRFLPVLHSLVPVTAGITGMHYRKFIAWTAPACTIWALAYVSVGALATAGFQQISKQLSWAGYIFVAIIVVFIIAVWFIRRWLTKRFDVG